jgi:hypothetical protein
VKVISRGSGVVEIKLYPATPRTTMAVPASLPKRLGSKTRIEENASVNRNSQIRYKTRK